MFSNAKSFNYSHGWVQAWPFREQPIVTSYYADLKHGPIGETVAPYLNHSLSLTLEAAESLVKALSEAIERVKLVRTGGSDAD